LVSIFSPLNEPSAKDWIMKNRRDFLAVTSSIASAASIASLSRSYGLDPNDPYLANIGIQLYTLRNQMQADPKKTLGEVARAGYKQIELMDVMDAPSLLPLAKDLGLGCSSAFLKWNLLGQATPPNDGPSLEQSIETGASHGLRYLVFGYVGKGHRETASQIQAMAERTNRAGEACHKAGIQLCYHHHSFEFAPIDGGKSAMEILIEEFDKELTKFEIDIFWAAIGGWDPVQTLERLDGRVAQVHLKDLLAKTPTNYDEGTVPKEAFKEVGAGSIDMRAVIATSKKIGVAQCHVEQDQSPDPVASIQTSIANLRQI
jgi:sugar phosphate isomerase/epimerase